MYETTERRPNCSQVRPKEAFSVVGLIFSPPANDIEWIEWADEPEPEPGPEVIYPLPLENQVQCPKIRE